MLCLIASRTSRSKPARSAFGAPHGNDSKKRVFQGSARFEFSMHEYPQHGMAGAGAHRLVNLHAEAQSAVADELFVGEGLAKGLANPLLRPVQAAAEFAWMKSTYAFDPHPVGVVADARSG
jgi:hypothetical protein